MEKLKITYKNPADLRAYARNARTHDAEQVAQIVRSIERLGFANPVLIDENNEIIAGHGRTLAALELGLEEIPVIVLAGLTETEKKALRLADNQIALTSGWDVDLLASEIAAIHTEDEEFDLDTLGFSTDEIDAYLDHVEALIEADDYSTKAAQPVRPEPRGEEPREHGRDNSRGHDTVESHQAEFKDVRPTNLAHRCPRCGFEFDD